MWTTQRVARTAVHVDPAALLLLLATAGRTRKSRRYRGRVSAAYYSWLGISLGHGTLWHGTLRTSSAYGVAGEIEAEHQGGDTQAGRHEHHWHNEDKLVQLLRSRRRLALERRRQALQYRHHVRRHGCTARRIGQCKERGVGGETNHSECLRHVVIGANRKELRKLRDRSYEGSNYIHSL